MKALLLFTFAILFLAACKQKDQRATGINYYFSNNGNDANAGTSPTTPWKTLAKFNSFIASAVASDSFLFNRGETFYGSIKINKTGVNLGAYGTGENPIITGFTTVTGFVNVGISIWESISPVSTKSALNMVLINGENVPMGRHPNKGYLAYTLPSTNPTTTKIISALPASTTNWTGATAVLRLHHWIMDPDTITAHVGTLITYKPTPNSTTYNGITGYGMFIQNDLRTLDTLNEWYYNPSTKKIRIYGVCPPTILQVATVDTLVWMPRGNNNISISNMKFTGSNKIHMAINSCANVTIQNCQFDYAGLDAIWGGQNLGYPSSNFKFLNNSINHTNNNAILLREEFTNAIIENDTIKNTALQAGMGKGGDGQMMAIRVIANGAKIRRNILDSCGYLGIYTLGSNVEVGYNYVNEFNRVKMDGSGIYSWVGTGTPPTGNRWHHNIVTNSRPSTAGTTQTYPLSHGIYLDWNVSNVQVDSNSVSGMGYSCLYLYSGNKNNNIFDNTFFDADNTIILQANGSSGGALTQNNTLTRNLFIAKAVTQKTHRTNTTGTFATFLSTMGNYTVNWYARPIDDVTAPNSSFLVTRSGGYDHWNLGTWKSTTGKDVGSSKSLVFTPSVNNFRFEYNATAVNKTVNLGADTYKDIKNASYTGSFSLAPYSSKVLIKQ